MNKKIISHDFSLVVADDSDSVTIDGFKTLDEVLRFAMLYKSYGDREVWWVDELIVYDDGSTVHNRLSTDWLDGYIT